MQKRAAALLIALGLAATANAPAAPRHRIIHQQKSLYRNILVVDQAGAQHDLRCMVFGRLHGYQSCIRPGSSAMVLHYTQAMLLALTMRDGPHRRALVIGLGGGSLPGALRALYPDLHIDSVELDPAMGEVARTFFGYRTDARSLLHIEDARVFVRQAAWAGKTYDLVLIDAFDRQYIPEHLLTREFLQQVASILKMDGAIAANTFTNGTLAPYETATYRSVFGDVLEADVPGGNRIILGRRDGAVPSARAMRTRALALDAGFRRLGIDRGEVMSWIRGRAVAPENEADHVLTDQFSPANLLLQQ